jgi:hypothetical protein
MTAAQLLAELRARGIELEPADGGLRVRAAAPPEPELREAIRRHKAELLALLAPRRDTIPRLPWQLERLLRAASSNVLEVSIKGVPDPARYVMAWGCAYLTGECDESVQRLWQVYRAWNNEVN